MVVILRLSIIFLLLSFSIIPKRILIMGDSISKYQYGYQDQLNTKLGSSEVNIAKGGMATPWMVKRLGQELSADSSFTQVFIYGGMNDAFNSSIPISKTISNLQKMVDLANQKHIQPIVIIGFDAKTSMIHCPYYTDSVYVPCAKKYIQIQTEMLKLKNCKLIPVCPFTPSDLGDGIHPNASGHKKLSDWIYKHL